MGIVSNPGHIQGSLIGVTPWVSQCCPVKGLQWLEEEENGLKTNPVRLREELEENFCCLRM